MLLSLSRVQRSAVLCVALLSMAMCCNAVCYAVAVLQLRPATHRRACAWLCRVLHSYCLSRWIAWLCIGLLVHCIMPISLCLVSPSYVVHRLASPVPCATLPCRASAQPRDVRHCCAYAVSRLALLCFCSAQRCSGTHRSCLAKQCA